MSSAVFISPSTYIYPSNQTSITGYYLAKDFNGQRAFLIGTTLPRTIYDQGLASLGFLDLAVAIACVVFVVITLVLVERTILLRLQKLVSEVVKIGSQYQVSAKVSVTARNGSVILRPTDLKFPVDVRSEYGSIDFFWPAGATSSLEARSKGGSVKWGLAEKPSLEKSNGVSLVEAFGGSAGAADISLSTSYGDIRIEPGSRKL